LNYETLFFNHCIIKERRGSKKKGIILRKARHSKKRSAREMMRVE
jgi:hypothetical protein